MSIFVVMARGDVPEALEAAIEETYSGAYFKYTKNIWFISASGNARNICGKLGVKKGGVPRTIVAELTGDYFGMAPSETWSWLREAFEKDDG